MDQFHSRAFANDDIIGSSFAYRVEAIRILGTVLGVDRSMYAPNNDEFEAIAASLSSWLLCLPPSKREILDQEGKIDEMLFQAHMIVNA